MAGGFIVVPSLFLIIAIQGVNPLSTSTVSTAIYVVKPLRNPSSQLLEATFDLLADTWVWLNYL